MEKNWEKPWDHCYVTGQKWWTRFVLTMSTISGQWRRNDPRPSSDFLHGCEMKPGSGLGMRLTVCNCLHWLKRSNYPLPLLPPYLSSLSLLCLSSPTTPLTLRGVLRVDRRQCKDVSWTLSLTSTSQPQTTERVRYCAFLDFE